MHLSRLAIARFLVAGGVAAALSMPMSALAAPEHQARGFSDLKVSGQVRAAQVVEEHNKALKNLMQEWRSATGADQAMAEVRLIELVSQRREALRELAQGQPGQALQLVATDGWASMPDRIRALLERRVELQGELELRYEHHEEGGSRLRYLLHTPNAERLELYLAGHAGDLHSGQLVRLSGYALGRPVDSADDEILLSADELLVLAAEGGADGGSNGGSVGSGYLSLGEQRTAVILVNYRNAPDDKPWSRQQAADFMFGPVSNYFMEASYGQTWLGGEALGWYTVPLDGGNCPSATIDEANKLATQSGVDLSRYDRLVYFVPSSSGCNANWATVGGSPSRAFITAGLNLKFVAHELGHNMGLMHAHGLSCSEGVLAGNCTSLEYGDTMDIMGNAASHTNPFQKELLGWLNRELAPAVTEVTTGGTYILAPTASQDSSPKGLKVLRGLDANGRKQWYYLDHRQPIGADKPLFASSTFGDPETLANGILLRLATEGDRNSSYLLDMTPGSVTWAPEFDLMDPALGAGISYVDADSGLTITPLWADEKGMTVDIHFEGGEPEAANRAPVAVNDSAGTRQDTAVTIAVLANDWDPDADKLSITAVGSSTGQVAISGDSLVYTPPAGFSGTEVFGYRIADGRGGEAGASVTVVVEAAVEQEAEPEVANQAPVASNDEVALDAIQAITIDVLANDDDPDGDMLAITAVAPGGKGSVVLNPDGTLTYTPARNFKNNDSFGYTISDGRLSASATVSIRLQGGDGGGKGNGKKR